MSLYDLHLNSMHVLCERLVSVFNDSRQLLEFSVDRVLLAIHFESLLSELEVFELNVLPNLIKILRCDLLNYNTDYPICRNLKVHNIRLDIQYQIFD